jgi:hypothetical protein
MLVKSGYLRIGRFRGAPIRLHWTVPLACVVFTRFSFVPGAWLGFVLLVLIHELGHAVLNFELILVNLLPIPPLDGAEAWGVIGLVRAARARRRLDADKARSAKALAEQARARAALPARIREVGDLHDLDEQDLPPMPEEVKRVLDRVMAQGRALHEGDKKK